MNTEKAHTCCFMGSENLPGNIIQAVVVWLDYAVESLIEKGVTTFISGGALGFDMIAASLIVAKKELGKRIRLVFVLPCRNQEVGWDAKQKKLYHNLLAQADNTIYVWDEQHEDAIINP